jgi:hypothetical protein
MFFGDALISWKYKKQDYVSKSSTEAPYHAMFVACFGIVWLCDHFIELGFPHNHPTPLHADNTNTTQIATNPVFHELFEHIKVDCHSIQEAFDHWVISLSYTSIDLQVVDVFIKAMTR